MLEQSNKQVSVSLDNEADDLSMQENELNFPWPLISVIKKLMKALHKTIESCRAFVTFISFSTSGDVYAMHCLHCRWFNLFK